MRLFSFPRAQFVGALFLALPALAAAPPGQPATGPGGVGDRNATIVKRGLGTAGAASFAYYKAGPAPKEGRPVAVVLHAWGASDPQFYGAWIDHLARNGWLVLFPRFQEVNKTRPADATANAQALLAKAFQDLAGDADAKPDPAKVALIGHLAGAPLAANLAAGAAAAGLPAPRLVFAAVPGGIAHDAKSRGIPLGDLSTIPADTMLITIIGDKDARAADAASKRLHREAVTVKQDKKLFLRALSDDHGFPAISATLAAPAGIDKAYEAAAITLPPDPPGAKPPFKWTPDVTLTGEQTNIVNQIKVARADTLDYLAFWRTFDMAADAAFAGKDGLSLKNDPRFSDMLRWADGWPVKRIAVEVPKAAPPSPPAATAAPAAPAPARRSSPSR